MSWCRSSDAPPRLIASPGSDSLAGRPFGRADDPHGWGAIVAQVNAENGLSPPSRRPNGSHSPRRPADPADTLNRSTYDAD